MGKDAVVVTEDDLEQQFREDPRFAIELLHTEFRENIFRYIKSVGSYLAAHEIEDIYQEMMVRLIKAVQLPDFDPAKPMRLVQDIAAKATVDFLRRKTIRQRVGLDYALAQIGLDWKDTTVNI